jgi:hypothetical protein
VRLLKSPWLVLALAVAVVAVPAGATGALPSGKAAPTRIAANSTTYTDSTGENPAAPDISTVIVSNNDAGLIQMRVNIPNRPALTRDMLIFMFIDSDANANTGDVDSLGADYVIQLFEGEVALFKWDGTDFTRRPGDPPATTLVFSYQAGVTFTISAAELGNTTRFGFAVIAESGITFDPTTGDPIFDAAVADAAPGGGAGFYQYQVRITPPTLVVRRVTTSPAVPRAGKPFTMRLVAARSDTGAVLQNGRVTCTARAGTTRLRSQVARVTGGAAVCTWLLPANAKGKTLRASTTVSFEGLRATRSISRAIR